MKLPHLTQVVELDRGMAHLVRAALHAVLYELLTRDPQLGCRLGTTEALSLTPLEALRRRVDALARRDEQPLKPPAKGRRRNPPKPHRLRVPYDQLTTLRFYYARLLHTASPETLAYLASALGRFHQPSLTLERHIQLTPPTGPGCQTTYL